MAVDNIKRFIAPPPEQLRPPVAPATDDDIDDASSKAFDDAVFHRSCYLAGPMSGYAEHNFPAFHKAAADLRSRGWKVFNPAEVEFDTYRDNMKVDLPAVLEADAVICLPDWEDSVGANLEVHVARVCDIPVLAYGDELTEIEQPAPPAIHGEYEPFEQTVDELIEELHGTPEVEPPESVCQEADRLVSYDRQGIYGHPLDDFSKVTGAANALGIDPLRGPEWHALYMVLVKLARLVSTPGHHDSIVDGCGYFKTYDMVLEERARRG